MTETLYNLPSPKDSGETAAVGQLRSLLVAGEAIGASAMQHRLYALVHRRNGAPATTGRVNVISRRVPAGTFASVHSPRSFVRVCGPLATATRPLPTGRRSGRPRTAPATTVGAAPR